MNIEQVNNDFDEIARQLMIEDQDLMGRIARVRRREDARVALVLTFLTAAAVLLAAGLATFSPWPWCAGLAAFLAASILDNLLIPK